MQQASVALCLSSVVAWSAFPNQGETVELPSWFNTVKEPKRELELPLHLTVTDCVVASETSSWEALIAFSNQRERAKSHNTLTLSELSLSHPLLENTYIHFCHWLMARSHEEGRKHVETHQLDTVTQSRLGCLTDMNSKRNREWLEGTNALTMWYYLYQRSKGDPVTHMCYATYEWSKKEHGACTSQGLGSPCHRCQLELIAVVREWCEWERCCKCDRLLRKTERVWPETEGIHLTCCHTCSNSILHSITVLCGHCSTLVCTNMWDGRPSNSTHMDKSASSAIIPHTVTVALVPMHEYTD